jgi:hypothetical protein
MKFSVTGIALSLLFINGVALANEPAEFTSPNADVPYFGVDGIFTMDTSVPGTVHDPRNPARIVFEQMERFSFYRDMDGQLPIAENCEYTYQGAAPDPFYYPEFQTSVWDLFELAPGNEACSAFQYVILRAPHGDPIHMHFRYGDGNSSFESLLSWWSVYCAEGVSACD